MKFCMRVLVFVAAPVVGCLGCTTFSLEQRTLNQNQSVARYRYREVLTCLAAVAANSAALPPFSILSAGTTRVTDIGALSSTTQWSRAVGGFALENLLATLSRSPTENWTIITVANHEQLEAMRCACRWVLYGPEQACAACPGLLSDPEQDPSPGPHFGVADRLARLPAGWLHVGRVKDVPAGACYRAHCGATWVWVMPDGMEGLADFTLVLQDIATLDTSNCVQPRLVLTLKTTVAPPLPNAPDRADRQTMICTEARVVKPEYRSQVEAILFFPTPVDLRKVPWDTYTTPLPGQRTNVSPAGPLANFAALRSVISAAGAGPYQGISPPPSIGLYPGVSPPPSRGAIPGVSPPPGS